MKKLLTLVCMLIPAVAFPCGDNKYEQCITICVIPRPFGGGCAQEYKDCKCLPKVDIGKVPGTNIPVLIPVPSGQGIPVPTPGAIAGQANEALNNISKEAAIATRNIASTIDKAFKDIEQNIDKSSKDAEAEIQRAGKDTEQAVSTIGRYLERSVQDTGTSFSDADKRLREGKVIDAVWHFGISPLQSSEKNAGKALLESSVLRTVGQVAATAYGGPQGAAAYAAWLTYRETGDPSLAIRVGVIAGATNWAMGTAGKMPSDTAYELAKKTVVVGAIGGAAVAAAGGNEAAVKEAFLKAGAMVVIQDTFQSMTKHELSGKASEGDPYCVSLEIANSSSPPNCAPPKNAYMRRPDGSLDLDANGTPKIDMAKVDPARAAVGIKSADSSFGTENSTPMRVISRVPGMQGMAVFHDQWATKWDMGQFSTPVTIAPAVVLTYWGMGAPYNELLRRTAIDSKSRDLHVIANASNLPLPDIEVPKNAAADIATSTTVIPENVVQSYFCTNSKTVRIVAVEIDKTKKNFACRVAYASEKGESFPWRTLNDGGYCSEKGRAFAEQLSGIGWHCMQSAMNRSE